MEKLEREHGWHEEEFDFIHQFMRTLLVKRTVPGQGNPESTSNWLQMARP